MFVQYCLQIRTLNSFSACNFNLQRLCLPSVYTRTLSAPRSLEITNLFSGCRFQVACQLKTFHSDPSYNHLNYFILQQSWPDIIQPYIHLRVLWWSAELFFCTRHSHVYFLNVHNHLDLPYTMLFSGWSPIQLTMLNTHVSRLP